MAGSGTSDIKLYKDHTPDTDYESVAAWFLGPRGENVKILLDSVNDSIIHHANFRAHNYNKHDPDYITDAIKDSDKYKKAVKVMKDNVQELRNNLEFSVPFFSPRYQAHMNWDLVLPGVIGYITALFYNQNNVTSEASPVTSKLELEVGNELCHLLGFLKTEYIPWGHITADGTVANIESMWVARNLKYLPLAIHRLLNVNATYAPANTLEIEVWPDKVKKAFSKLNDSELYRLNPDLVLEFLNDIAIKIFGSKQDRDKVVKDITPLTLPYLGYDEFAKLYKHCMRSPKIIAPVTRHYSWPKAATVLGLGEGSVLGVKVDKNCRMDLEDLKKMISYCNDENFAIVMIIGVVGTTAEGAVDPMEGILQIRHSAYLNMNYIIHVDAAWGGYVRSILHDLHLRIQPENDPYVPTLPLSEFVQRQYRMFGFVDSITIDPHKAGYIPYPAGSLCYRNGDFRYIINMTAPVLQSDKDINVGTFGIEGSKPGAAPTGVWLAHKTIPLNHRGYGLILSECMFTVKRYYCQWLMLPQPDDPFVISMIHPLSKYTKKTEEESRQFIKDNIIGKTNDEIAGNEDSLKFLAEIGPDILINGFVFNFKDKRKNLNKDVKKVNELTEDLLQRFSMTKQPTEIKDIDILIMGNDYESGPYSVMLDRMEKQLGYEKPHGAYNLRMINSTILNPWPTVGGFLESLTQGFRKELIKIITEKYQ